MFDDLAGRVTYSTDLRRESAFLGAAREATNERARRSSQFGAKSNALYHARGALAELTLAIRLEALHASGVMQSWTWRTPLRFDSGGTPGGARTGGPIGADFLVARDDNEIRLEVKTALHDSPRSTFKLNVTKAAKLARSDAHVCIVVLCAGYQHSLVLGKPLSVAEAMEAGHREEQGWSIGRHSTSREQDWLQRSTQSLLEESGVTGLDLCGQTRCPPNTELGAVAAQWSAALRNDRSLFNAVGELPEVSALASFHAWARSGIALLEGPTAAK